MSTKFERASLRGRINIKPPEHGLIAARLARAVRALVHENLINIMESRFSPSEGNNAALFMPSRLTINPAHV
jgi:hypothetical protein